MPPAPQQPIMGPSAEFTCGSRHGFCHTHEFLAKVSWEERDLEPMRLLVMPGPLRHEGSDGRVKRQSTPGDGGEHRLRHRRGKGSGFAVCCSVLSSLEGRPAFQKLTTCRVISCVR
jgi:hypothetical protein